MKFSSVFLTVYVVLLNGFAAMCIYQKYGLIIWLPFQFFSLFSGGCCGVFLFYSFYSEES
jgi:hypothetical protein